MTMTNNEEPENGDRRKQILEAALKVFSTKGFHKATNKDIAQAAGGISPGLIYWYFKDKEDLFLSIIRERAAIFQLADHPERLMELPPREGLALIGRTYLSIFKVRGDPVPADRRNVLQAGCAPPFRTAEPVPATPG